MMIKKASGLIQMTNNLTMEQRKIYNYLLFIVKEVLRAKPTQRRFEAEMSNIKKYTGAQNNSHIKESIEKMQEVEVKFNVLGKEKKKQWDSFDLIVDVDTSEDGFVSFSMPEQLIGAINYPDMYALIDLKVIKGLKSKHSVAIYEFISDYIGIGKRRAYLDDFKVMMGIDPKTGYKRFSDLKTRVIDPCVEEINEKTSIRLVIEPTYRGRKAISLEFRFIYCDEVKSEKANHTKKEQFQKYRDEIYKASEGRPVFVYKNREVVVDKHPKKEKIMVGYKTIDGVEWYSNEEAMIVWNILVQNKVAVDAKLWEYHCEDLPF